MAIVCGITVHVRIAHEPPCVQPRSLKGLLPKTPSCKVRPYFRRLTTILSSGDTVKKIIAYYSLQGQTGLPSGCTQSQVCVV
jgi:hypothetical protein